MGRCLFSYVVRYDSGFAPNPFHGYCTLATCKPNIRARAQPGDWVVGTGSAAKAVGRGGHLVYAMRVTEAVCTARYGGDSRFEAKKPDLYHNWVSASGDNIYEPDGGPSKWRQLNSYHSNPGGGRDESHVRRDTGVERVLISDDYVYFGGEGPELPEEFRPGGCMNLLGASRSYRRIWDEKLIAAFESWLRSLGVEGYEGRPWDWLPRG